MTDNYLHPVILLAHTITDRLKYITEIIAQQVTGQSFKLTTNEDEYISYPGPKINYTNSTVAPGEFWIVPHTLLFEAGITTQKADVSSHEGLKIFFASEGDIPFDIFAASFYLLSRYEEYLPHQKDMYGRFAHDQSLAYRSGFLHEPLVNKWILFFRQALQAKFPGMSFREKSNFSFIPTYDIDEAYSFKHKNVVRVVGAAAKAVLKGNFSAITQRQKVVAGKVPDPYDAYDWMDALHVKHNLQPYYFFLVAGKTAKYDRNILPSEPAMQALIKRHASKYTLGIHPSWQSGDDNKLLTREIAELEKICGNKIVSSRQHYIRFTLPQTFDRLVNAGILNDYSMGYGSINGFRASFAQPFYWYDLLKEKKTTLLLHPFCYMEANSFFEQKYPAQQALEEMRHYYHEVKSVGGQMITIWHNSFLGTGNLYRGWREMYSSFINEIV